MAWEGTEAARTVQTRELVLMMAARGWDLRTVRREGI
jgi:hypothetical protein